MLTKTLLRNLDEYRQWSFKIYNKYKGSYSEVLIETLGINPPLECWDSICDKNGNWLHDINEDGSIIPETTAENLKLSDWLLATEFPIVVVHCFDEVPDRFGHKDHFFLCTLISIFDFS